MSYPTNTMTNPVTLWSQLIHTYIDETLITITNLDHIWMTRYPPWKELTMATNVDILVLSFKILNNCE